VDSVVSGSRVVDISGEGNSGTLNGGAAYSSTDRAFAFDGTDDYIQSTTTLGSGNISITFSMWIKSDAYGDWVMWLGADAGSTGEALGIIRYQNEYQLNVRNGNTFRVSAGALNTWEHLVFIYHGTGSSKSAGTIEGFVNGVLGTVTLSTLDDDQLNIGANPELEIGARTTAAIDNYFDGSISNFKTLERRPHRRRGRHGVRPRTHREVPESHRYEPVSRGDRAEGAVGCEGVGPRVGIGNQPDNAVDGNDVSRYVSSFINTHSPTTRTAENTESRRNKIFSPVKCQEGIGILFMSSNNHFRFFI
jgi:hypothetical protein